MKNTLTSIWLWLLCLVAGSGGLHAQSKEFRFSHLQEGLSNVLAIHQDRFGFMWFGTKNGLHKYNGYQLEVYENNPHDSQSIKENWVSCIAEDSGGNLYIGTFGGGLNILNRSTNKFRALIHEEDSEQSLAGNVVLSLNYVSHREILVGTNQGLCIFNAVEGGVKRVNGQQLGFASNYISAVAKAPDGSYWVGTNAGLNLWMGGEEKAIVFGSKNDSYELRDLYIRALAFDSEGTLWVGTNTGGLHAIKKRAGGDYEIIAYPLTDGEKGTAGLAVLSIFEDSQERLWIGTEGGGVSLYNRPSDTFKHYRHNPQDSQSISNYSIWSIGEDHVGNIWFGTFNKGISKIDPYFQKFNHLVWKGEGRKNSLSNNIVNAFYEDPSRRIWIGTDRGGMDVYDPSDQSFTHYAAGKDKRSLSSDAILAFQESDNGKVWMGTWGGGISIAQDANAQSLEFKHLFRDQHFFALANEGGNQMWAGSWGSGLLLVDENGRQYESIGMGKAEEGKLTNEHILSLLKDSKGRVWVGTLIGLNLMEKNDSGIWELTHFTKSFDDPHSISSNTILCIYEDSKGQIWVGTEGGLNLFSEDKRSFSRFYKSDGLAGSGAKSIVEDRRGHLWIATNQGLSQYDPISNAFQNYDKSDGLLLNDFNARSGCLVSDGTLYLGTTEGAVYFKPEEVKGNPHLPKVYITDFKLFNKAVPIGGKGSPLKKNILLTDKIILSPKQSVFSFEFVALNYTHTYKNEYAYRLKGLEEDWNFVGDHRFASYSSLDAGTYTFEVIASNNDGVWNTSPASIEIEVLPAWYESVPIRLAFATLLIIGAVAAYKVRVNILHRQKRALEKLVQARTQEVLQKKEEIEVQAERLKDINFSLEEKVARRTADLKEAYNELNQFTYHSAHDLKGPIARLLGLCYLAGLEVKEEKAKEYFQRLEGTAKQLNGLLSELMRAQEMKNKEVVAEDIHLEPLLRELFAELLPPELADRVRLFVSMEEVGAIVSDSMLLAILFENLIKNAIDFRDEEVMTEIHVVGKRSAQGLDIWVNNNGVGIAEDIASKVFDMFVVCNEKSEGRGLGLYEARIIAKKLKGHLALESSEAGNTSFKVSLPLNG